MLPRAYNRSIISIKTWHIFGMFSHTWGTSAQIRNTTIFWKMHLAISRQKLCTYRARENLYRGHDFSNLAVRNDNDNNGRGRNNVERRGNKENPGCFFFDASAQRVGKNNASWRNYVFLLSATWTKARRGKWWTRSEEEFCASVWRDWNKDWKK